MRAACPYLVSAVAMSDASMPTRAAPLNIDLCGAILARIQPAAGQTLKSFVRFRLALRLLGKEVDGLYAANERGDGIWPAVLHHYGLGISVDNGARGIAAVKEMIAHLGCKLHFCDPGKRRRIRPD